MAIIRPAFLCLRTGRDTAAETTGATSQPSYRDGALSIPIVPGLLWKLFFDGCRSGGAVMESMYSSQRTPTRTRACN